MRNIKYPTPTQPDNIIGRAYGNPTEVDLFKLGNLEGYFNQNRGTLSTFQYRKFIEVKKRLIINLVTLSPNLHF